ncbi:MAG: leucine-rich repeat domain-containing protein, partial [Bacteroidales bacterium]|nr:leucine-rich repeat domain-containing protein [Bacteroidales bacterium]
YKFITIPNELDGQTIKGIKTLSENGIFSHKGIYELTLPTTLEEICFSAFAQNNLTSIDLLRCENLHTIDQYAFYSNSITTLVIPSTITTLGYNSFAYNNLEEVTIALNSQLNLIGSNAFNANTENLEVTFPSPLKEGYTFKYWINWDDDTFEGGVNIPDFKREYEAVFTKLPTSLRQPATDRTKIEVYSNQVFINSPEPLKVAIYNLNGQLIHQAAIASGKQSIDITSFGQGTYILKASNKTGTITTKKIKTQ